MEKLLIVDDSIEIRKQLKWGFGSEYQLLSAENTRQALGLFFKHRPRVIVLDLGLPAEREGTAEGFRCLSEMLSSNPSVKVIIITGNDDTGNALRAVQNGAYDYLKKPIEMSELKVIIRRAFHMYALEEENRKLRLALDKKRGALTGIVGQCRSMVEVFSTIRKVAGSDVPVLIQGESGTGKELIARAIHTSSARKERNFTTVNCGILSETLLEAELFGQEAAGRGAPAPDQGRMEYARGGTLFLDELADLAPPLQVRLLRFLQEKTLQRAGGGREETPVEMRIVAATNRVMSEEVKAGRFREDLYYRIGVVTIQVPPLRERKDDIMILATLFLMRSAEEFRKRIKGFSSAAVEHLESYGWPGNVRELENKVQRAVILSEGSLVEPHDLGFMPRPVREPVAFPESRTLKDARDRVERQMIMQAMDRHKGNIAQAAEDLGISRPTFYDIMKKHGLFHMTP